MKIWLRLLISLMIAVVSTLILSCKSECLQKSYDWSTPESAFASLKRAIENHDIQGLADSMFIFRYDDTPIEEIGQNMVKEWQRKVTEDPNKFWKQMSFGGFLLTGNIRNIDIIEPLTESTDKDYQLARIFIKGTATLYGQRYPEMSYLGLFQLARYEGRWFFVFMGCEDSYYAIAPLPNYSTPQEVYRTVRNAQRMLDWNTLYNALATMSKYDFSKEDYQKHILKKENGLVTLNTIENNIEPKTHEEIRELEPLCDLPRCKITRRSRGIEYYQDSTGDWTTGIFVKENENWRWVPSINSEWIPEESMVRKIPAGSSMREIEMRNACASNLRQIGIAFHLYAADHNDSLPESLGELYPDYIDDPNVFDCPSSSHIGTNTDPDYNYDATVVYLTDPSTTVIAQDKSGNHSDGKNVLYLAGNVKWVTEYRYKR